MQSVFLNYASKLKQLTNMTKSSNKDWAVIRSIVIHRGELFVALITDVFQVISWQAVNKAACKKGMPWNGDSYARLMLFRKSFHQALSIWCHVQKDSKNYLPSLHWRTAIAYKVTSLYLHGKLAKGVHMQLVGLSSPRWEIPEDLRLKAGEGVTCKVYCDNPLSKIAVFKGDLNFVV